MENNIKAKEFCARGIECHAQGDLAGAIAHFDQALADDPRCAEAWNNRGAARHALGDVAGALADFDQALSIQPKYAEAHNNRGMVRLRLGEIPGACREFDQALAERPRYVEALLNRGAARQAAGHFKGAVADFDRAIGIRPTSPEAFMGRAAVLSALDDLDGAAADYDRVLELVPETSAALVYHYRADVRGRLRRFADALADVNRSLELAPPSCMGLMTRGNIRYHLRDPGGVEDYRQAWDMDATAAAAEFVRLVKMDIQTNLDDALENCRKHLRISPQDLIARGRRGLTLFLLGQEAEAAADFAMFRQQAPQYQHHLDAILAAAKQAR